MIRNIVHDSFFLSQPSKELMEKDDITVKDLLDTLKFHQLDCVGMAANMIGENKRIIAININSFFFVMYNPVIVEKSGAYETEEGCLSLSGKRKTIRYKKITLEYRDISFKKCKRIYEDYVAQIIQHEVDHCNGVLI